MQLAAGSYSSASIPAASILAKVEGIYETLRYEYVRNWRHTCCVGAVVAEVSCGSRRECLFVGMEVYVYERLCKRVFACGAFSCLWTYVPTVII